MVSSEKMQKTLTVEKFLWEERFAGSSLVVVTGGTVLSVLATFVQRASAKAIAQHDRRDHRCNHDLAGSRDAFPPAGIECGCVLHATVLQVRFDSDRCVFSPGGRFEWEIFCVGSDGDAEHTRWVTLGVAS